MKESMMVIAGGLAALGVALLAVPSRSSAFQEANRAWAAQAAAQTQEVQQEIVTKLQDHAPESNDFAFLLGDEGASWLGVETHEVTSENMKNLKLSAERGVVLGRITPDSPAAKAGLKENDVITEFNGQRIEGVAQFRRMIHEVPAGRTVQFTIWRDGGTQTVSAALGQAEENRHTFVTAMPRGSLAFNFQDLPKVAEIPQIDFGPGLFNNLHPRLGIDAEDIGGQLGSFFGVPGSEGILVRGVNAGSAAEKAGLKAGDVITTFNSERIRSVGDLREKLAAKSDGKAAKIGVLRNKSELTLTVELPAPQQKVVRKIARGTNI